MTITRHNLFLHTLAEGLVSEFFRYYLRPHIIDIYSPIAWPDHHITWQEFVETASELKWEVNMLLHITCWKHGHPPRMIRNYYFRTVPLDTVFLGSVQFQVKLCNEGKRSVHGRRRVFGNHEERGFRTGG